MGDGQASDPPSSNERVNTRGSLSLGSLAQMRTPAPIAPSFVALGQITFEQAEAHNHERRKSEIAVHCVKTKGWKHKVAPSWRQDAG